MNRFRNILYVVEPSVPQEAGLARAVSLAENHQAKLTLIDVIPEEMLDLSLAPRGPSPAEFRDSVMAERRGWIESLIAPHADRVACHLEVLTGITFIEVIRAVLQDDHDLVIKTAENPEWSRMLFGSDDMHLMRKCPCPVWLIEAGGEAQLSMHRRGRRYRCPPGRARRTGAERQYPGSCLLSRPVGLRRASSRACLGCAGSRFRWPMGQRSRHDGTTSRRGRACPSQGRHGPADVSGSRAHRRRSL